MTSKRTHTVLLAAWLIHFGACVATASDGPLVFPLSEYPDGIFLPVTIGSSEHLCLLDSGATSFVFHSTLREHLGDPLGIRLAGSAIGQGIGSEEFSGPVMKLGSMKLSNDTPVLCIDMQRAREATGRDIEGMLGMPFFRTNIVQIDFDRRRVVILPSSTKPNSDWGRPIKVRFTRSDLPTIGLALGESLDEHFEVDTGSNGSLSLKSDTFARLLADKSIRVVDTLPTMAANGSHVRRQGRLSKVTIGEFENQNLLAAEGSNQNSVGLDYLRRFRVTFDLSRNRISLAKGVAFEKLDQRRALNIGVLRKENKQIVAFVQPDSEAAKAGIRIDDELVSVAGETVSTKPNAEIHWLIREKADQNGDVLLLFQRDGSNRTVRVRINKD